MERAMQQWRPEPVLRQKLELSPRATDLEIFQSLSLGDTWEDASLRDVYWYLRRSGKATVPDSWVETFDEFDASVREFAPSSN